jgi:hypothetical protein
VVPVPDPLLFFVVPGIEPGPSNLTTRPQRRSLSHEHILELIVFTDVVMTGGAVESLSAYRNSNH